MTYLSILASSIRIKNKLDEMGLNENQAESFIENINIYCFKHGLTAEEFLTIVNNICSLSENLGMPVGQLPNYIMQQQLEVEQAKGETEDAKLKKFQALQDYNVTMDDLEEYRRNKPLIDRIKQLENDLEEGKQEKAYLIQRVRDEQMENTKLIQQWKLSCS